MEFRNLGSGELPTIFALSSAPGRAGVMVVRVSGAGALQALDAMVLRRPSPRVVAYRAIVHPETREAIDQGLVLWMPGPQTFTGEDVLELHLHGGRAILQAVLGALALVPGLRLAEPGEFSRRAFDNGKADLAALEGVADLIEAETEGQRRQALGQARGTLSALYEGWRQRIIEAQALVEAGIDFSDEADVSEATLLAAKAIIREVALEVMAHLNDGHRGEVMRNGLRVVLAGAPNAGKSSLLNALARRDVAIVSAEAGTTRDVIEVRLDLEGFPVIVSDTAGLREACGEVEREGMRRTMVAAGEAHLVLWLEDAAQPRGHVPLEITRGAGPCWHVLTKIDLIDAGKRAPSQMETMVSVRTGEGVSALIQQLGRFARGQLEAGGVELDAPLITQARHRQLIEACSDALADFVSGDEMAAELCAEDLRRAAIALGRITGRVDVEDVLDQVFMRFCIGK